MNMQSWLKEQHGLGRKKAMPILSFPSIQLLGVTVHELVGESDMQAKGMKMVADRVNASAAVSMMDLSVEAEAFGSNIRISDAEVPTVLGGIVANAVSMKDILERVPEDVLVMGNVDPAAQFANGSPASIRTNTLRIMEECCGHPNFVISSGCDIPPASPWENIDAFFRAVDAFYDGRA